MTGTQGGGGWSIYFSWSALLFYRENVFCFARTPAHMPAFGSSFQVGPLGAPNCHHPPYPDEP